MAKISFYGSWIDVKSLNKKDKKNYVTSMVFTILGAFAWGMHLAGNETGFLSANNEGGSNTGVYLLLQDWLWWFAGQLR
jgi:hypothetical protein